MNNSNYTLDIEKHRQLVELIEDSVEFFCDENMISGELSWLVVETLAQAKLMSLKGNL